MTTTSPALRPSNCQGVASFVPTLDAEQAFWRSGLRRVAGVDEVGRGAMAGPLVAAAVVLPSCTGPALRRLCATLSGVRDSKLLRPDQREALLPVVIQAADAVGIGVVDVDELDAIGVGAANRLAMERAVLDLRCDLDALLLDACVVDLALPQVGLIDGDARCLSIAAASIVAKVTRDRAMIAYHATDPRFGFAEHKGYCTPAHLAALTACGPGPWHRRSFAPVGRVDPDSLP